MARILTQQTETEANRMIVLQRTIRVLNERLRAGNLTSSAKKKLQSTLVELRDRLQLLQERASLVPRTTRRTRTRRSRGTGQVSILRDTISKMLKSVRQKANLNQAELAVKLGIPAPNISRMESGSLIPSLVTIDSYFRACGFELNISAEAINVSHQSKPAPSTYPGS